MQLHTGELAEKIARLHEGLCALHQAFSETSKVEMAHREQLQLLLAQATELHTALLNAHTQLGDLNTSTEEETESDKEVVLIVEDDETVRFMLKRHFESEQIEVREATSAEEALQIAEASVPDLIISDVVMSGMDGYTLCKVFKTRTATSHIPIVLLTAKNELEDKLQGLEVGADDYIHKPFNIKEVWARVRNLLLQRKALREAFFRQLTQVPMTFSPLAAPKEDPFLTKVRAMVEKHLSDETYTVDRLAFDVFLSRVQLFRKLKSLVGLSPLEFISSIRLGRAAELLQEGKMSVAEVCIMVGFGTNYSYFSKRFKERFALPPSEFAAKAASRSTKM
ncbi:MAG: response regulator [Chloroherpetonaceae bacterium]